MTVDDPHTKATGTSAKDSIASEATDQASRLAGSVKDEVTRREKDLRSGIAERAESVAAGLRKAGSEIDPDSSIATMFDRAADSVSGLAGSLNATDPAQMVEDVRSFARRQPGAFLGLSALAGFAAIRFLRAGSVPSSTPMNTSGFGDAGMTRRPFPDAPATVGPAGTATVTPSAAGAARAVPTGTVPTGPAPTGPVPGAGGRNDGGSHA
ncbi:hypothetical protein E4191_18450 (plasmid) [Paracoccus liaowanqingii]|uniref:DUF3618 domain-containing protein n=1 Tax=Paracoccus liaowanqingii TaxID=2560053 RepID=A0A4Y5STQ7_9RHOB|nr:hypothetical protein [Paracoccus liaowanqingii]QDA36104.1 hypothetical protein E4191_18450 [Paracoccus liaowanqingii]